MANAPLSSVRSPIPRAASLFLSFVLPSDLTHPAPPPFPPSSGLKRTLKPSVLLQLRLSDGRITTFEVPVDKFHQLRYNTAFVLKVRPPPFSAPF